MSEIDKANITLSKVHTALNLLSSMVSCGEKHSESSRHAIKEAKQQLLQAKKDSDVVLKLIQDIKHQNTSGFTPSIHNRINKLIK